MTIFIVDMDAIKVLTEVVDFINQNGLKTQTEIAKMPLIQYGTFSKYLLEQYYHVITEPQKRAIAWIVVTIELLDTDINYKLFKSLEKKLTMDDSMLEFLFNFFSLCLFLNRQIMGLV